MGEKDFGVLLHFQQDFNYIVVISVYIHIGCILYNSCLYTYRMYII